MRLSIYLFVQSSLQLQSLLYFQYVCYYFFCLICIKLRIFDTDYENTKLVYLLFYKQLDYL